MDPGPLARQGSLQYSSQHPPDLTDSQISSLTLAPIRRKMSITDVLLTFPRFFLNSEIGCAVTCVNKVKPPIYWYFTIHITTSCNASFHPKSRWWHQPALRWLKSPLCFSSSHRPPVGSLPQQGGSGRTGGRSQCWSVGKGGAGFSKGGGMVGKTQGQGEMPKVW